MQKLYDRCPETWHKNVVNRWKKLGPFDLRAALAVKGVQIDNELEIEDLGYFRWYVGFNQLSFDKEAIVFGRAPTTHDDNLIEGQMKL